MEITMLKNYRWLPAMLLTLGVGIATPGCATRITAGRGEYRQNVQRRAFDEGHRKGVDRGRDDARHGRQRAYEQDKDYRNGDGGYRRDDGDRDAYRDVFRQGFRTGYAEAFDQRRDQDDRGRRR
jgi:hypothetical protein